MPFVITNDDISDDEFEQMIERCSSVFSEHDRICLQMERSLWSSKKSQQSEIIRRDITENEENK